MYKYKITHKQYYYSPIDVDAKKDFEIDVNYVNEVITQELKRKKIRTRTVFSILTAESESHALELLDKHPDNIKKVECLGSLVKDRYKDIWKVFKKKTPVDLKK